MLQLLSDPQVWISLLTLALLEIVLGIDNIVFISILTGKLPESQRATAWRVGLGLALGMRVLLLLSIKWVMGLTTPLFALGPKEINGRDLILLLGGIFLIYKAVKEIHEKLEGAEHGPGEFKVASFTSVLIQILLLDLVFSLDSVITAVGMAKHIEVMIAAVIIAVAFMMAFAMKLSQFVHEHPTIKLLALAFLVLIGTNLVAEGWGAHIEKAYTYFAMGFAVIVELLNMRLRAKAAPVELHEPELTSGNIGRN